MKNTKKKGKFTIFSYQEKSNYYIGVCLEFDLIVEGKTPREALKNILNASIGYLIVIIKNNLNNKLLNLTPDQKYLREYTKLLKRRMKRIEKIKKVKKQKKEKLIPWNEYFSSQDIKYNPDFLKNIKKEEVCV
ncbi:MAG: hypothetical protein ACKKMP_02260 [Candidatus Nealsonbacteria bacterium]